MTSPTYVGSASSADGSGSSAPSALTLPASIADGDIGVLVIHCNQLSNTLTPPSGWTVVDGPYQAGGNNTYSWLLTKTLTAAESSTAISWSWTTFTRWAASVVVARGGVFDASMRAFHSSLNANVTGPAFTPVAADCLAILLSGLSFQSGGGSGTATAAAGWTERQDAASSTTGVNVGTYAATKTLVGQAGVAQTADDFVDTVTHRDNTWVVTLAPSATPLTVSAGSDQTVEVGANVNLSATGAPGSPTLSWAQISGTTVTLNGTGGSVSFTAPSSPDTLVFEATADDGSTTVTDDMTVTVTASSITRRAVATAATSNGWNTTGTKGVKVPDEARSGDLLFLHWSGGGSVGPVTDPATLGWTLEKSATSGNVTGSLWSKVATATDAGTTLFGEIQTTQRIVATVAVYSGTDATAPVNDSQVATETTSEANHPAASITTSVSRWLIRFLALRDSGTRSLSWTPPASFTVWSERDTASTTFGVVGVLADTGSAVAAATYAGDWTIDQSSNAAVDIVVALEAGSGSVADVTTRWGLDASGVWQPLVTDVLS